MHAERSTHQGSAEIGERRRTTTIGMTPMSTINGRDQLPRRMVSPTCMETSWLRKSRHVMLCRKRRPTAQMIAEILARSTTCRAVRMWTRGQWGLALQLEIGS